MKTVKFNVTLEFDNITNNFTEKEEFEIANNIRKGIYRQLAEDGISPEDSTALTADIEVTPASFNQN